MKRLYIVGVGPGSCEYLTKQAYEVIMQSKEILAFARIKELMIDVNENIKEVQLNELIETIRNSDNNEISILLSGDINFHSATKFIQKNLDQEYEIILIPGLTSYQILCSKVNLPYEKMKLVSLHGQNPHYLGHIMSNKLTFILCDSQNNINKILDDVSEYKHLVVYIGENLGMKDERITIGQVEKINKRKYSSLAVIIIENNKAVNLNETLYDVDFIRTKVPMSKQEIRWLVVPLLDLKPTDIVYDIGSGSGSITIGLARQVYEGHVYAVEKNEDAYQLTNKNIDKFQAYNTTTYCASALDIIDELPLVDKVFIGGSGNDLPSIVEKLISKNKMIVFVITCITLETQLQAISVLKKHNIYFDVINIASARSKKVASYNMMYANNPITIIKGVFSNES